MKLLSKQHIFKPTGEYEWSLSHAQVPFAFPMASYIRVFFSTRDRYSRSAVSFVDLDKNDVTKVLYVHDKAVLSHGAKGSFDDSGTMPSWFVQNGDEIWMYYTAWNKSENASYRLSIGLAISKDDGLSFEKVFPGPILDRGKFDPIWVGQPCVLKFSEQDWRMWYLSCQKVELIDNHPEPFYNVKYATSLNGIDWKREEKVCIDFDKDTDAIGRPCVWFEDERFKMLHSNRMARGYRNEKESAYRIEYSESKDGISWVRKPDVLRFDKSASGWDDTMNEYCTVFQYNGLLNILFNGNGFGASGFGLAQYK